MQTELGYQAGGVVTWMDGRAGPKPPMEQQGLERAGRGAVVLARWTFPGLRMRASFRGDTLQKTSPHPFCRSLGPQRPGTLGHRVLLRLSVT